MQIVAAHTSKHSTSGPSRAMAEASETPFLLTRAPMSAVDEEVVTPLVKGMDFYGGVSI